MPPTIQAFIRAARDSYEQDTITIVDGYEFSQYETLVLCELYTNSRYYEGQTDSLGRLKPFYNVVNRVLTVSSTAEDIDRKDITLTTDNPDRYIDAWMFTVENRNWMKNSGFGQVLNHMTWTRGKYGGVLVKKTETDDDMRIDVVDWRNIITDPTDIVSGIKVERHFYNPSQLLKTARERNWDMEAVANAIERAELNQEKDSSERRPTFTPFIEVMEAHGVFPKSYWASEEEVEKAFADNIDLDYEFEDRVFIIANVDDCEETPEGMKEYGCVLFTEVEEESVYKYLPYERVPGRALGRGRVESAFESQQATNDVVLKQKDILDLAAKTLFVTTSKKVGTNVLTGKRTGDIIKIDQNQQFTTLNTTPTSLQFMPSLIEQWNLQLERATSTFAANTGESLPSGTPYRLVSLLNQEANSSFKDRQDEMGIFIQEIYKDWVIPYLKKRLQKKHVLVADFSMDELRRIDKAYIDYMVKDRLLTKVFEKKSLAAALQDKTVEDLYEEERVRIQSTGSRRFLDVPENYYDDLELVLEVNVTNEDRAKAVYLESLSSILTTVSQSFDPNTGKFRILEDPKLSRLFSEIMETAGYSPVNMEIGQDAAPDMQQQMPSQLPQLPAQGGIPALPGLPQEDVAITAP